MQGCCTYTVHLDCACRPTFIKPIVWPKRVPALSCADINRRREGEGGGGGRGGGGGQNWTSMSHSMSLHVMNYSPSSSFLDTSRTFREVRLARNLSGSLEILFFEMISSSKSSSLVFMSSMEEMWLLCRFRYRRWGSSGWFRSSETVIGNSLSWLFERLRRSRFGRWGSWDMVEICIWNIKCQCTCVHSVHNTQLLFIYHYIYNIYIYI